MKYSFKIFFTFSLMIICHTSFSQKSKTESKEIQEIKLLFKDATIKKMKLQVYPELNDTIILPAYFTNYRKYYDKKNKFERISLPDFVLTNGFNVKLNKSDCDKLNSSMLNDTNHLNIQRSWFTNYKIKILSDSITKMTDFEYMKPIFFRNYTRCFVAILYDDSMDSFFLKKENNHWVLDKTWVRWIKD